MTDINKLEELAKAATEALDSVRNLLEEQTDEAHEKLDGAFARYETLANPSTLLALISQYRRMEEALRECADDLENEIKARANNELPRRIARDLETVTRARQALQDQIQ